MINVLAVCILLAQDSDLKGLQERVEKSPTKGVETYTKFKPEFEAFAARHAGTEDACTAKLWLLQNVGFMGEKNGRPEALKLAEELIAEYIKSKQLAKITEYSYFFTAKKFEGILNKLMESPHDEVKGVALVSLAKLAARNGSAGKARQAELLKTVKDKYAGVPWKTSTCGKMADAILNVHPAADLEVGKKAPDLEGVLADGKTVKLSDFRGKVVVLDFFGDW